MSKTVIDGASGLKSLVGKQLGASPWTEMTYDAIRKFADATGDHQWIHVDRERAKSGPFGAPIAHGYFTLSLIAGLFFELVEPRGFNAVLNYGLNKVRFPSPLKAGQRYRLAMKLANVEEVKGGVDGILHASMEAEGSPKPCCAAEVVFRFLG